jgi:type IV secretion system protein VirB2
MYHPRRYAADSVSTPRRSLRQAEDLCWNLLILCSVFVAANILPISSAFATPTPTPAAAYRWVVLAMIGITGKAIATVGIIVMGLGALFGKLSWPRALMLASGIALVFGASSIVAELGAGPNGAGNILSTTTTDTFTNTLNGIINIIQGPTGVALSTLAIIALGISAILGKASPRAALLIAVGMALIFGGIGLMRQLSAASASTGTFTPNNPIETGLNFIITEITGPAGTAVGTLALIALGLGALFGKITYPTALVFVLGITLIFGGVDLVKSIPYTAAGIPAEKDIAYSLVTLSGFFASTTGQVLGIIAVIALGVGAFFGKISFPVAAIAITGFALIYGSVTLAHSIRTAVVGTAGGTSLGYTTATDSSPAVMLVNAVNFVQSDLGEALGAIGVAALGAGAFFGKISYPSAIVIILGIALVFGSVTLVKVLGNGAAAGTVTSGTDCVGTVMGKFATALQGTAAKALGSLGVMIVGIGALFGKISYPTALVTVVGVATVFGAQTIMTYMQTGVATPGYGGAANSVEGVICEIADILVGSAGQAIATIVIICLGIGAMLGKVSYHLAITIIVGIGCMFGAQSILSALFTGFTGCTSAATTLPGC